MKSRLIKWDKEPLSAFKAAITYIRKKSLQNSEKVKEEILGKIDESASCPEIHPPDKWNSNKLLEIRAFELHHFRVSYQVKEAELIIVRFRHTSQQPETY